MHLDNQQSIFDAPGSHENLLDTAQDNPYRCEANMIVDSSPPPILVVPKSHEKDQNRFSLRLFFLCFVFIGDTSGQT